MLIDWPQILLAAFLAGVAALSAHRMNMLDRGGAWAAALLGTWVLGLGGWPWAALLLLFFASSNLFSRAFRARKAAVAADFAKGGRRDWAQVAANGGVPALALLAALLGLIPLDGAWLAYAGALAAVNADTWATELGVLSPGLPRLITTGRRVARGSSGAISLVGSLASLLGALLVAAMAFWFPATAVALVAIPAVALAGLAGAFLDSLLGATVQAIYYCPACEKDTERHPWHSCGSPTTLQRGWRWLDNDWVNFISAAFGALMALLLTTLLASVA